MTQIDPQDYGEIKQLTVANAARIKIIEGKVDKIIWLLIASLAGIALELVGRFLG